jgi:DNA-binding YbaB/EbfC family protein
MIFGSPSDSNSLFNLIFLQSILFCTFAKKNINMFGDLMGNMEEKQKALQDKLKQIEIEAEAGDGAVVVTANGNKELLNIKIDQNKISLEDVEELEDLVLIAVNRALSEAGAKAEVESQALISDMLPPGLGGLFGQ